MSQREFDYTWVWSLQAKPEALWSLAADTNRFDRDSGVPALQSLPSDELTNARTRQRIPLFGTGIVYEQEPFEWIYPYRFGVIRNFVGGPIRELRILAELKPRDDGGTDLSYQVRATARNLLGMLLIPLQIGILYRRTFARTFQKYDSLALANLSYRDTSGRITFPPGGKARLAKLRQELLDAGANAVIVGQLVETINKADDLSLARMRPYTLADYWQAPRRDVLELFLWATRIGLLDFRWELLCPVCYVSKARVARLSDIHSTIHCETCRIDYSVNFDRSVELTFQPNAAVRQVDDLAAFCIGAPMSKPHVAVQQLLPAGTTRTLTPHLEEGRYHVRVIDPSGGQFLDVEMNGVKDISVQMTDEGLSSVAPEVASFPQLELKNDSSSEQLFMLERMVWVDQAATAAEVTAMQMFRDLFSKEALRPGKQFSVGKLAVLFTDIQGSTRLYRELGDAPAFGIVMEHFELLREAIEAEGGALVKTIGDSVMVVFTRPIAGMRMVARVQQSLASLAVGERPLLLKAGLHYGPSIAVTLNDQLDYFGSTVNIGSRLEALSQGGDVIISEAVRRDPEVADFLEQPECCNSVEPIDAELKGFENERFDLWRVELLTPQPEVEETHTLQESIR